MSIECKNFPQNVYCTTDSSFPCINMKHQTQQTYQKRLFRLGLSSNSFSTSLGRRQ